MKNRSETNERSRFGQRRRRTNFSNKQLNRLEEVFEENRFPGIEIRDRLTEELGIREDRIQVWFQNRRARWRRHEIKNKPTSSSSSCKVEPEFQLKIQPEPSDTLPSCRYPYGVPQFTFPVESLPYTSQNQSDTQFETEFTVPSPTTPFIPLSSCQLSYGIRYSFEEYEAAFGLLSVFGRQN